MILLQKVHSSPKNIYTSSIKSLLLCFNKPRIIQKTIAAPTKVLKPVQRSLYIGCKGNISDITIFSKSDLKANLSSWSNLESPKNDKLDEVFWRIKSNFKLICVH